MGNIEIEYKFVVSPDKLPQDLGEGRKMVAGYFTQIGPAIRATYNSRGKGRICIKGPGFKEREEFEYEIPYDDAVRLVGLAPTELKKTRYEYNGWEIDFFEQGLVMAEWEESRNGPLPTSLPDWLEQDVTNLPFFTNQSLAWFYGEK
jgi:CYTH domain-containing protein